MSASSTIEWTDATWNPVRGCTRVSPGCGGPGKAGGCYAEAMAARFSKPGQPFHGFAEMRNGEPHWTGKLALIESALTLPLHWKKPRRIFVNSMSDLFHEKLPDEAIDKVLAVMALCPRHTFQVLTKRAKRMRDYLLSVTLVRLTSAMSSIPEDVGPRVVPWHAPLLNVWLGVSVEDQPRADERRADLATVAALGFVTFVSYEPALGPVDWRGYEFLSQLISGGESGYHARPSHAQWHRDARDWCARNDISYFFKQWGEWWDAASGGPSEFRGTKDEDDRLIRVGKRAAGRLLDGVEHNGFPEIQA